jgi:MSHA biogenesis protein MshJ
MRDAWTIFAGRIDALNLRERALIFWTVLICSLVLADQFWLSPAQIKQRQVAASVKQQSGELEVLRAQLGSSKTLPAAVDTGQTVRAEMVSIQTRIESLNKDIARMSLGAGESDPLPKVLVHLLRRYEGLTLEHTATLAPEVGATPSMVRQGIELTVSGSYGQLLRYVQALEQELPALRWGGMKLTSGKPASQLNLQVFWLAVAP